MNYVVGGGVAPPRRCLRSYWAAGLIALLSSHALAVHAAASDVKERTVRDLYYGEVLFHYYQQDYFAALTHLLGAQEQERIETGGDTDLLRVGIELTYGLHDNAYAVFKRSLDDHVTPAARDRIWLSLAEIWQRRGYLDRADDALARIGDGLGKGGRAEQALLKAHIQMARGSNADAALILATVPSVAPDWSAYLRYNQAVALRRAGLSESANSALEDLGTVKSTNAEVLALRDRANIALGFAYLKAQAPAAAKEVLERVRLDSPFADQALLGLGWAEFNGGNYYNALISWTELRNRGMSDATNYEARILVPYAQRRLHAYREAVEQYRAAVTDFDADLRRLDAIIAEVKNGKLIDRLLADDAAEGALPQDVAGARAMPYLVDLLASNEFQDALATYRNLKHLENHLDTWSTDLSAFGDVVATRRVAYEQVLPEVQEKLRAIDARKLESRVQDYVTRLDGIARRDDAYALATAREQRLLAQSREVETILARRPQAPELAVQRVRARVLRGLSQWEIEGAYKARLWETRKGIDQLVASLDEAKARRARVLAAQSEAPKSFRGYDARIASMRQRVARLQQRLGAVLQTYESFLRATVVTELYRRRQEIQDYGVQTRYAVAGLLDEMATGFEDR